VTPYQLNGIVIRLVTMYHTLSGTPDQKVWSAEAMNAASNPAYISQLSA
jgi:hypothetical protein